MSTKINVIETISATDFVSRRVKVTLRKECRGCREDISITAATAKATDFGSRAQTETYRRGICNNCSWLEAHADGKDHFMESKEAILGGLTESQYQAKHGVAWNE